MWYRVFSTTDAPPEPAAVLEHLHGQGADVAGHFRGDDLGWFRADLTLAGVAVPLERYLTAEDDLRDDLNTWAAWLEAQPANPHQDRLMQHVISTRQLFTVQAPDDGPAAALAGRLARFLAAATAGVYQADGQGFCGADGTVLVAEEA